MRVFPKKPIGVWFGVALALLTSGLWSGWKIGKVLAIEWYARHRWSEAPVSQGERAEFAAELSTLSRIEVSDALAHLGACDAARHRRAITYQVKELQELRTRSDQAMFNDVISLNLGLAYIEASMLEEGDKNESRADESIKSAEGIFQRLGWKVFDPDTLKSADLHESKTWRETTNCGDSR
jgi:hypothetical protein